MDHGGGLGSVLLNVSVAQVANVELQTNVLAAYVAGSRAGEIPQAMASMRIPPTDSFEIAFNRACGLLQQGDAAAAEEQLLLGQRLGQLHHICLDPTISPGGGGGGGPGLAWKIGRHRSSSSHCMAGGWSPSLISAAVGLRDLSGGAFSAMDVQVMWLLSGFLPLHPSCSILQPRLPGSASPTIMFCIALLPCLALL